MNIYKVAGTNPSAVSDSKMIFLSVSGDVIVTLNILAGLTRKMLTLHMFKQVHSCLHLASRLYESGNEPVRNAVEDIYIRSFIPLHVSCTSAEWCVFKAMMPGSILKAYRKIIEKS